jgi:hypothetical protein
MCDHVREQGFQAPRCPQCFWSATPCLYIIILPSKPSVSTDPHSLPSTTHHQVIIIINSTSTRPPRPTIKDTFSTMAAQVLDQFLANEVDHLSDTWFLERGDRCGICRDDQVALESAMCYGNRSMTAVVKTKLCGHVSHQACLHRWLYYRTTSSPDGECPFCLTTLVSKPLPVPVQAPLPVPYSPLHKIWAWCLFQAQLISWVLYPVHVLMITVLRVLNMLNSKEVIEFMATVIILFILRKLSRSFPSYKIWARLLYLVMFIFWILCLLLTYRVHTAILEKHTRELQQSRRQTTTHTFTLDPRLTPIPTMRTMECL